MNMKFLLSVAFMASAAVSSAQTNKTTYAITSDGNQDFTWMNIREVDLSSGHITKTIFERSKTNYTITDISSKVTSSQRTMGTENIFTSAVYPTGTFVAAAALDKRTNKLFFTPMRKGELRWLDLNESGETAKFYTMPIGKYKMIEDNDEATNITRMVIGADGNGYALSNDGNHFFSFTTGKNPVITELGNIIDADVNAGTSIHNKCSSWGGDMIADAFGKLYVISANHNVFVIDVNTRIATFKGSIQGLPAAYTTNAAAVNEEGAVVVASANYFEGYYTFKMADLKAIKLQGSDIGFSTSDFASSNLLSQREANNLLNGALLPVAISSSNAKVFPNPVTNASFNIMFNNKKAGKYVVVVTDLAGRIVLSKSSTISEGSQNQKINLNKNVSKGLYIVKVLDDKKTVIINEKILIQ